jgi:hypothetical protein
LHKFIRFNHPGVATRKQAQFPPTPGHGPPAEALDELRAAAAAA